MAKGNKSCLDFVSVNDDNRPLWKGFRDEDKILYVDKDQSEQVEIFITKYGTGTYIEKSSRWTIITVTVIKEDAYFRRSIEGIYPKHRKDQLIRQFLKEIENGEI